MLRGFQSDLKAKVYAAWESGNQRVMMQSATGSGKTVIMGSIARDHANSPWDSRYPLGIGIAHRNELVGQISSQFAREGIMHDIIAPKAVVRGIVDAHMEDYGRTFYNPRGNWKIAGVDTLVRREFDWVNRVGSAFVDEAHHVLRDNKWGKALAMFPYARGLLPTATPIRADRKGLGSDYDGMADILVQGPPPRWLVNEGYLTDYKVYSVPPTDLNIEGVHIGANGDFNPKELAEATRKSQQLTGNVVSTYITHARGKLGVTFAADIRHANELAKAFNEAGVPAVVLTGEDDPATRRKALRRFARREIWQLVNVDLFGEGFDLPAIECVSFARATASFALYSQQWGRALRLMVSDVLAAAWDTYTREQRLRFIAESGKPFAYIFDHVNNFYRHEGPPDRPRLWSLEAWGRSNGPSDSIPMRVCLNVTCAKPYERVFTACPYCGTVPPLPTERASIKEVEGDITLLSPEVLAVMMREVDRIDGEPLVPAGVPRIPVITNHRERQAAQHHLRNCIDLWAGSHVGHDDRSKYKRFYFTFGMDVVTAKTLNQRDAQELQERINADIIDRGYLPYESN